MPHSHFIITMLINSLCISYCAEYRSFDGYGNNLEHPEWGSKNQPYIRRRSHLPRYQTDNSSMLTNLPNARLISNIMGTANPKRLSQRLVNDAHTAWGQFISLDLFMTVEGIDERQSIPIPVCDLQFDPQCNGTLSLPFTRSTAVMKGGARQQLNWVSAFLDGSMIYGADVTRAAALRKHVDGQLLVSPTGEVPVNAAGIYQFNPARRNPSELRMTGDPRGNVSPQILAYTSLFVRDHNRYCKLLKQSNPTWDDETLYQEARRRVIAHLQHITVKEYLPTVLGGALPLYAGYNASINPTIDNFFATCTSLHQDSQTLGVISRLTKNWVTSPNGSLFLRQALYNPATVLTDGIEPILRGMLFNAQWQVDTSIEDDLRNHLYENLGVTPPTDQLALSIQRGRDHGQLSYVATRKLFGLPPVTWQNITSNAAAVAALQQVYSCLEDVDALIGGLAEDSGRGCVGDLFKASIRDQFLRLRSGDRFWYQNGQFDDQELQEIENTSLTDIVNRNTNLQYNYALLFYRHDAQPDGGLFQVPLPDSPDLDVQYNSSLQLSGGYRLYWSVDYTAKVVHFAALARAGGWVGLGFAPRNVVRPPGTVMYHVDMAIAQTELGPPRVNDYFSFELGTPSLDTALGCAEDLQNASIEVIGDTRIMRFSRTFATNDSIVASGQLTTGEDVVKRSQVVKCDAELQEGETYYIIWAFHSSQGSLMYHGANRGFGKAILIPARPDGSQTGPSARSIAMYIGIAAGLSVGLLATMAAVLMFLMLRHARAKNNEFAPQEPPFCLLFTDIEQSTLLWSMDSTVMGEVIERHTAIIRQIIAKHKAYEVKTIGDSFMIATFTPMSAVQVALDIQLALYQECWSARALDLLSQVFPNQEDVENPLSPRAFQTLIRPSPWNGPRVRIGIHLVDSGVTVDLDQVSGRYDYYGPPVNAAARIESVAHGGQVLVSSALVDACSELKVDNTLVLEPLGKVSVKGIRTAVELFQVSPIQLCERVFPPICPRPDSPSEIHTTPFPFIPETLPGAPFDQSSEVQQSTASSLHFFKPPHWNRPITEAEDLESSYT